MQYGIPRLNKIVSIQEKIAKSVHELFILFRPEMALKEEELMIKTEEMVAEEPVSDDEEPVLENGKPETSEPVITPDTITNIQPTEITEK